MEEQAEYKLCECGCGLPAPIPTQTNHSAGRIKGIPLRFVSGHNSKFQPTGKDAYRWRGGLKQMKDGRYLVLMKNHPRSDINGYVLRSILVAEKALGKSIPLNVDIHHFDENKSNDSPHNLIICENRSYHLLLHSRKKAYEKCGNPNWKKCYICKKYDDPKNLFVSKTNRGSYHRSCKNLYEKKRISKLYG